MEAAVQWLLQDGINIGKAILMALIIFVVGRWIAVAIKKQAEEHNGEMERRSSSHLFWYEHHLLRFDD